VFVCTLFSGVATLIRRGAQVPENPILSMFSKLICMAPAMCAALDSAVSTL
jgi:hypothetical protein